MKDLDIKPMTRADLEDEVMLLRAQVKVLQDWVQAQKAAEVKSRLALQEMINAWTE